jgi:hypothetical protein
MLPGPLPSVPAATNIVNQKRSFGNSKCCQSSTARLLLVAIRVYLRVYYATNKQIPRCERDGRWRQKAKMAESREAPPTTFSIGDRL